MFFCRPGFRVDPGSESVRIRWIRSEGPGFPILAVIRNSKLSA